MSLTIKLFLGRECLDLAVIGSRLSETAMGVRLPIFTPAAPILPLRKPQQRLRACLSVQDPIYLPDDWRSSA